MIHPLIDGGGRHLASRGMRVTSLVRPNAGEHSSGRAMDVARWKYGNDYSRADAARVMRELVNYNKDAPWVVVAEQDHVHVELGPRRLIGVKNRNTRNQLKLEEAMEYGNLDDAADRIGIGRWELGVEKGQPMGTTSAAIERMSHRGVQRLVRALDKPQEEKNSEEVQVAAERAPDMLVAAQQVKTIRAATERKILWVDYKNARELANSLGHGALMRQSDIVATAKDIANGIPAFEPRVFTFNVVDPTTFDFFPTFAIGAAQGGPLPTGEIFKWISSHIRITASVFNSVPGIQANIQIDFGTGALPLGPQTMLFELGKGTEPVIISPVHGVIASGLPRLQTRFLTVQAGAPVPGVNFPRITVTNLNTALFQAAYRYAQPGDAPTDRFSDLLA